MDMDKGLMLFLYTWWACSPIKTYWNMICELYNHMYSTLTMFMKLRKEHFYLILIGQVQVQVRKNCCIIPISDSTANAYFFLLENQYHPTSNIVGGYHDYLFQILHLIFQPAMISLYTKGLMPLPLFHLVGPSLSSHSFWPHLHSILNLPSMMSFL